MGQGRVYRRGRIWWIQYNVAGIQKRESTKTKDKTIAEAVLRTRLQAIWEGTFFELPKPAKLITLTELVELWLSEKTNKISWKDDRTRLIRCAKLLGESRPISTITPSDISSLRAHLTRMHLKRGRYAIATINRHLSALHALFEWAANDHDYRHRDPMRGIKLDPERNGRNRLCTPEEYQLLRDAATGDLRGVIVFGYWTGMRLGEIAILCWDHINLNEGVLYLDAMRTKEGVPKTVPLFPEIQAILKDWPCHPGSLKLFRQSAHVLSLQFARLCKRLGIRGLHFHDLRHTAETRMVDAGIDIFVVQAITGHLTFGMTKRYRHVNTTRLKTAVEKILEFTTRE